MMLAASRGLAPRLVAAALPVLILLLAAWPVRAQQRSLLYQVSSIAALLAGVYDGEMAVGDLRRHGDFGLGTFDGLDGEMIMLDGVCYQALVDGDVRVAPDEATTPFAAVAFFRSEGACEIRDVESLADLTGRLDRLLPNRDGFYAVRLSGDLDAVTFRSVPKQSRPYKPLTEAIKGQQVHTAGKARGDLAAIYCPPAAEGLNVVGWHIHYINAGRTRGGHLLDVRAGSLRVEASPLAGLQAKAPASQEYDQARLCEDRSGELERIER